MTDKRVDNLKNILKNNNLIIKKHYGFTVDQRGGKC